MNKPSNKYYQVDDVLALEHYRGQTYYLIKWKGYPEYSKF